MLGKVVGSMYNWSSFCFIYWKMLKSKTLKYFTLKWYEPTKITACNCLCKIMVTVTTSGSRINFPCMSEPNAFAYSDFHLNDYLLSSLFFPSYTWKPLKEKDGKRHQIPVTLGDDESLQRRIQTTFTEQFISLLHWHQ